mmetsp:Transcript_39509/g.73657  ORF Transcript_39509/g.73657 Transcript_39509/m.73657 type:complete len:227 (+) Transcript_39509:44-724(+)
MSGGLHVGLASSSSSLALRASRGVRAPGALLGVCRPCTSSWGSLPTAASRNVTARDVARTLRLDLRPATSHGTPAVPEAQKRSTADPERPIATLATRKVAGLQNQCPAPRQMACFKDRLVLTDTLGLQLAGRTGTTLDFACIRHAELDTKTQTLKLRMAEGMKPRHQAKPADFGPECVQMEFQGPDFEVLQELVWPLLMQAVVAPGVKAGKASGMPRGPSLVWSHA